MRDKESILARTVKVLGEGGVILYPTDTVWGLGCLPHDESAIRRLYQIKQRAEGKACILLAGKRSQVEECVGELELEIRRLVEREEPTTLIFPKVRNETISPLLLPMEKTVAIRLCRDPFCVALIRRLQSLLVSTSANISGMPTPQHFRDISSCIREQVDYVVPYRQAETGLARLSEIYQIREGNSVRRIR